MELQSIIYQHLSNQENSRKVTLDKTKEYLAADQNYQNWW